MPKRSAFLPMILVPVLALVIACSGDDDTQESPAGGQNSASQSDDGNDAANVSSDNPANTGAADGEVPQDGGATGDDGGSTDAEAALENCPELLAFVEAAGAGVAPGGTGSLQGDVELSMEFFQNLAANAPGEIQGDMQVVADAYSRLFQTFEEYNIDFSNPASFAALDPATSAELQASLESIATDEVSQAELNIDQYFQANCS